MGPVTILVNNAGVAWRGTLDDYNAEQVARMRRVNVEGVINATRAVILFARWAALILAAYTLALGLIFHTYWLAPAADARFERIIFFNHLSIIGGMLAIVAFGAGCLSLDAAMRRKG